MTNNHAFYTIPKIEVVYHTPGHYNTDPQRLSLILDQDDSTQLPPSRYRAKMVSKDGNTTPLLIYSEQQHNNMFSLLLPLKSITQNPGIPRRTDKILVLKSKLEFET